VSGAIKMKKEEFRMKKEAITMKWSAGGMARPSFFILHSACARFARFAALLALGLMGFTVSAGPTNAPATAAAAPAVEALVIKPPFIAPAVPQSVFVIPKKQVEGRDPFFPRSTRVYGITSVSTNKTAVVSPVAELSLKGISGSDENPLAIINTTTFAAGEENDVTTKAGKMRIRCIEINKAAGTVTVQVGGERRELRLK
jgi:hypothetical protein